jgi:hypothetical protein
MSPYRISAASRPLQMWAGRHFRLLLPVSLCLFIGAQGWLGPAASTTPRVRALGAARGEGARGGLGAVVAGLVRNEGLSLALGSLCLTVLVVNRLATEELYDSQSRTDILAVISSGGLLLNGLTLQDVAVRVAEKVELKGASVTEESPALSPRQRSIVSWAMRTALQALPDTGSALIRYGDATVGRRGVFPEGGGFEARAIIAQALTGEGGLGSVGLETYIPDLQILPGKIEFEGCLPANCQSVLIQPFDAGKGLMILGGSRARNYTPAQLLRVKAIAQKVQRELSS